MMMAIPKSCGLIALRAFIYIVLTTPKQVYRQDEVSNGVGHVLLWCRVDTNADGRITEDEVKEVKFEDHFGES